MERYNSSERGVRRSSLAHQSRTVGHLREIGERKKFDGCKLSVEATDCEHQLLSDRQIMNKKAD